MSCCFFFVIFFQNYFSLLSSLINNMLSGQGVCDAIVTGFYSFSSETVFKTPVFVAD